MEVPADQGTINLVSMRFCALQAIFSVPLSFQLSRLLRVFFAFRNRSVIGEILFNVPCVNSEP